MTPAARSILPPLAPFDGFWAASRRNGHDPQATWTAVSEALADIFDLTPAAIRDFLDSVAGRVLAEDLSFIEGGPIGPQAIRTLIMVRLDDDGWRRWYGHMIAHARAAR